MRESSTRWRVDRVERWGRRLLSEPARRGMLEPFLADHLAEADDVGQLPASFEAEAVRLLLGAFVEDRRRRVLRSSWPHLALATALAVAALGVSGAGPMQGASVLVGVSLAVALSSAGEGVLRVLGRSAPILFVVAAASLALFGAEAGGRRAWLLLGPVAVQPGTLLLPLVLLVPGGWRSRCAVTATAAFVFVLGDWIAAVAMLVVWLPSGTRGLAFLSALLFAPLALADALPLVTVSGSATVALLVASGLLRHRPSPPSAARPSG